MKPRLIELVCSLFWASLLTLAYLFPIVISLQKKPFSRQLPTSLTPASPSAPSCSTSRNKAWEDNTFTNGLGRDTTLIGNLVNATVYRRLLPNLEAELRVFANIPFGHDTEVSQVRPIVRLTYQPIDQLTAVAGTIRIHTGISTTPSSTAATGSCVPSSRAQMLVDSQHYQPKTCSSTGRHFRARRRTASTWDMPDS